MITVSCYYCNTDLQIKNEVDEKGGLEYIGKCPVCGKEMLVATIECGYEDDEKIETFVCWYTDKLEENELKEIELVHMD